MELRKANSAFTFAAFFELCQTTNDNIKPSPINRTGIYLPQTFCNTERNNNKQKANYWNCI